MDGTPNDRRYTTSHEWAKLGAMGNTVRTGITKYHRSVLGQVLDIGDPPAKGTSLSQNEVVCEIKGTLTNTDFHAAVGGHMGDGNEHVLDINLNPYGDKSWIIEITDIVQGDWNNLMTGSDYDQYVAGL